MRKKEIWMFKGALVLVENKKATITKLQENNLNGIDYVYYVWVKYEGDKKPKGPYHPNDINELVPQNL